MLTLKEGNINFEPAWAKDANGKSINSYYKVDGNTLVQVVDFDENTAFPVVADPSWWQITKCAAILGVDTIIENCDYFFGYC